MRHSCPIKLKRSAFRSILVLLGIGYMAIGSGCKEDPGPSAGFDLNSLPLERLSDYQLFEGPLSGQQAGEYLLPYDLNTPLFTDYAGKARFIYIPPGEKIVYEDEASMDFPVGTLLFKTFYYYNDERDPSLGHYNIETRVLARLETEWKAYSYIWNAEQSDAVYRVTGGPVPISWIQQDGTTRDIVYLIPNQVECQNCHQIGDPLFPLGAKPRNLNKDHDYDGTVMNQLEMLEEKGWLIGAPPATSVPPLPVWNDPATGSLERRARAYLDVNCAHCHRPEGDADNSGLFLNFENENTTALGFCKPPVAAGGGSGGFQFGIVPGKPDSSILVFRMASDELDIRMPEAGRTITHVEGVELIEAWIASLTPVGCP